MDNKKELIEQIKQLPHHAGVYLFKNMGNEFIYIGKAKDLRNRVVNYLQQEDSHVKAALIIEESVVVEHILANTELQAMLLEAQLIQRYQPKFNVLLKDGQPFLYLMITPGTVKTIPQLVLTRNHKKKGTYFGPFIEKGSVRKVHAFLIRTFRLHVCKSKVDKGCLYYHMGICAGTCRKDFDKQAYLERLELAKNALRQGHKKFLRYLQDEITKSNEALAFEKSKVLHSYFQAFEKVFTSLNVDTTIMNTLTSLDIWMLSSDQQMLYVFDEKNGIIKQKREFYLGLDDVQESLEEYMLGFYRTIYPATTIIMNFDLSPEQLILMSEFLQSWHKILHDVIIQRPVSGHLAQLLRLAEVQIVLHIERTKDLANTLKRMLKLPLAPRVIDCFDISHKQGMFLVGGCVRFVDGKPDKNKFRKFKIKTVHQSDDYACLREVVSRRYAERDDFPDLILIDGGKGQLNAVKDLFPEICFISLAKREETVFSGQFPGGKILDQTTYAAQTLLALRDYTHHFAISYHRQLAKIE